MATNRSTSTKHKVAFYCGAAILPVALAVAVFPMTNKPSPVVIDSSAPATGAQLNQTVEKASSRTVNSDHPSTFAEGEAWIRSCLQRHGSSLDGSTETAAEAALGRAAWDRCSAENSLKQTVAIRERRKAINNASPQVRGNTADDPTPQLDAVIERHKQEIVDADAAIAAIKQGKVPHDPTHRAAGASEVPKSLEEQEAMRMVDLDFHNMYGECMTEHKIKILSPEEYADNYGPGQNTASRAEAQKARKAHLKCQAQALQKYPSAKHLAVKG